MLLSSSSNPKILYLCQLRKKVSFRKEQQSVLVTGEKFIREIAKVVPLKLLVSTDPLPKDMEEYNSFFYQIVPSLLSKVTGLAIEKGMVAEFAMPKASEEKEIPSKLLVLERINDPGNLGAIIRSQVAFGWEHLFLLPGCCDLFNEKVVRASAATLFHIKWREGNWDTLRELVDYNQFTPLVADLTGEAIDDVRVQKPCLLLSNEASGLSEDAKQWGQKVTIPMSSKVESLNAAVAASILLYTL